VKVAVILHSSFGWRNAFVGANLISFLYFSGTFHSYYRGILDSFLTSTVCLDETPTNVGGKKSF